MLLPSTSTILRANRYEGLVHHNLGDRDHENSADPDHVNMRAYI